MKPGEIYWVDLATGRRPGIKGEIDIASGTIGRLSASQLRDVIKAIGDVIDSDCEPN
jgi:hypothetical protein